MPAERPAEASAGSEVSESTAVVIPQKGVAASLLYLKPKGTPGDIQRCPPDYHTILNPPLESGTPLMRHNVLAWLLCEGA